MTTVPTCAARPSETTSRPGKLEGPGVSDDLGSPLRASMAVSARPFLDLRRKPPAMARRLPHGRASRGAPVGSARSGGQQVGDLLDRLAEPESLAGPVIELVGDGLEMRPVVDGQVGALGEVLA